MFRIYNIRLYFLIIYLVTGTLGMNTNSARQAIPKIQRSLPKFFANLDKMNRDFISTRNFVHEYVNHASPKGSKLIAHTKIPFSMRFLHHPLLQNKSHNTFGISDSIHRMCHSTSMEQNGTSRCNHVEDDRIVNDGSSFIDLPYVENVNNGGLEQTINECTNYSSVEGNDLCGTKKQELCSSCVDAQTELIADLKQHGNHTVEEQNFEKYGRINPKEQDTVPRSAEKLGHNTKMEIHTVSASNSNHETKNRRTPVKAHSSCASNLERRSDAINALLHGYFQGNAIETHPECIFLFKNSVTDSTSFKYMPREQWRELTCNQRKVEGLILTNSYRFPPEHLKKLQSYSNLVYEYVSFIPSLYATATWGYVRHGVTIASFNTFLVKMVDLLRNFTPGDNSTAKIADSEIKQLDEVCHELADQLKKLQEFHEKVK
ncbi:hypothetical protein VCUG_01608 [Vavraia culicis subsp. floridensis]|uniref:Uncharacterized protein n=1 Tax=Vavraia culicis (isolate floridensis) TaxID=948595 RepID=L2GV04_VAVCU|nr:uncharacterized protein VCUG_01608 [Vavraia culicis subsp. floridensis]ELA46910.1 hypothetical protein VCUG_01608 [Vavraia culicis subsp. floridensis]